MRTIGAVLLVIGLLFVGVLMMSSAGDSVEDTALNSSNQSQELFNFTESITGGASNILVQASLWGGMAAIVLTSIGVLVYVSPGGR